MQQNNTLKPTTLSMSGRHTLGATARQILQPDKASMLGFKATTNLNHALYQQRKPAATTKGMFVDGAKQLLKEARAAKQIQKQLKASGSNTEQLQLEAEVAALSEYKPPVSRDQTKQLIEKITMNRRQKHMQALDQFAQDTQEYLTSVRDIYSSIKTEAEQFININNGDIQDFLNKLSDQYLLSREKEMILEIENVIEANTFKRTDKINSLKTSLTSFQKERSARVEQFCTQLRKKLIDIAFVLQKEAQDISEEKLKELSSNQVAEGTQNQQFIAKLAESSEAKFKEFKNNLIDKQHNWRQLKHNHAWNQFKNDLASQPFVNSTTRSQGYEALKQIQNKAHQHRVQLLEQLVNTPNLSKAAVERWTELLKNKNDESNALLDKVFGQLLQELNTQKSNCQQRTQQLKARLNYIGLLDNLEVEKLIEEQAAPIAKQLQDKGKKLLNDATAFAEKYDARETQLCQNIAKFVLKSGTALDEGKKKFEQLSQQYQLSKAKILDDDEEKVDKLTQEFEALKKQLRQALHHIKLQEVAAKAFAKIDDLEQQYRSTHVLNKQLAEQHPAQIEAHIQGLEKSLAQIFYLYDLARKQEILDNLKKQLEAKIARRMAQQEKKKAEDEARLAEETTKKGGKAPPAPKPKDPKKVAAEQEERKQALLKEYGAPTVTEFTSTTGKLWLVSKQIEQICKEFYIFQEDSKGDSSAGQDPDKLPPKDAVEPVILDPYNIPVVSDKVMVQQVKVMDMVSGLCDRLFNKIVEIKKDLLEFTASKDKEFLEESLETLDDRLKKHYSMKGKLESEVFVKRSAEITNHKKKYERHAREVKEKMDMQTQKFNLLLEKSLQLAKAHTEQQKKTRQELQNAKNLSQLQGLASRNRENASKFEQNMRQIVAELTRLSTQLVQDLIDHNARFLQDLKDISQGGEYSAEETAWYKNMMEEITKQLTEQQTKRTEKANEIEAHTTKKRQELYEAFEKSYAVYTEELAAKDCSGKTYGKPKRLCQQRLRGEMNKCEKAQENLVRLIESLRKEVHQNPSNKAQPDLQPIRKLLMTIRACIGRYGKHIEAFKPDSKLIDMVRVSYNQDKPDIAISATEQEEDDKRKVAELKQLGPLSEQKDDKKFMQLIDDIEKAMKEQVVKIYVGDKAKYLGADKLPDFLRNYIANMKKNADTFRLNCIRDLRVICNQLAEMSEIVSQRVFSEIEGPICNSLRGKTNKLFQQFRDIRDQMEKKKSEHMRKLRPNLSNPACRQELDELNKTQQSRSAEYLTAIEKYRNELTDAQFQSASKLLNYSLNNFEFLILFFDALPLAEDFVKLPGDQTVQKKHLNIKQLMILKQKGTVIDTSSERNISKKWEGVNYTIFDLNGRKYEYVKTVVEEPKVDNKKAAKKETKKDPAPVAVQQEATVSKTINSFKTQRQKSAFVARNELLERFKLQYDQDNRRFGEELDTCKKQQESFVGRWKKSVQSLITNT